MSTPTAAPARRWWLLGATLMAVLFLGLLNLWYPEWFEVLGHTLAALLGPDDAPRRALVERLGVWGPLALLLGMLLQAVIPLLPAAADVVLAGLLYGFWGGLALVYSGTLLGAALGYAVGRRWGQVAVHRLAGERLSARLHQMALERGAVAVLLVRLMPALKAEIMNLVAGAVGIPFWPFMAASALGALPATALVVWLSGNPQRLLWGTLGMSALVALGAGLRMLWLRWHSKHHTSS